MPTREPERLSLADLPTPLIRLTQLEREFDRAQIWMKRDDLTGLELSGNKVRKLEFVVAETLAAGCDTLVTEGTSQSNHCRATAAVCAKVVRHAKYVMFQVAEVAVPRESFWAIAERIRRFGLRSPLAGAG